MTSPYSGIQIISENEVPIPRISYKKFSLSFKYPTLCNADTCKPLEIKLQPGSYQLECWGAKGEIYNYGQPGLGAYTSGVLTLNEEKTLYIVIGATGYYNSIKGRTSVNFAPPGSGGATDVRLSITSNWSDIKSLATRIMVAAGGGSAEFSDAIGGHGGTLEGGQSEYQGTICKGATQTRSQSCPNIEDHNAVQGSFGSAGIPTPSNGDDGGFGGNGYYGGTSYTYAYAGSGGSSFISGHEGCKAIEDPGSGTTITHKEDSIHYSGLYFNKTQMIAGNEEMPLPDGSHGIWSESNGAFRITYLLYTPYTCMKRKNIISLLFICDALSILQLS